MLEGFVLPRPGGVLGPIHYNGFNCSMALAVLA